MQFTRRKVGRAARLLAVAAAAAAVDLRARALTITWEGPSPGVFNGTFQTSGNWNNGVPGAADTANFNLNQAYTVTLNASTTTAGLTMSGATARVTFNSSGATRT